MCVFYVCVCISASCVYFNSLSHRHTIWQISGKWRARYISWTRSGTNRRKATISSTPFANTKYTKLLYVAHAHKHIHIKTNRRKATISSTPFANTNNTNYVAISLIYIYMFTHAPLTSSGQNGRKATISSTPFMNTNNTNYVPIFLNFSSILYFNDTNNTWHTRWLSLSLSLNAYIGPSESGASVWCVWDRREQLLYGAGVLRRHRFGLFPKDS